MRLESSCKPWGGSFFASGYGRIWRDGKHRRAHREVWAAANGPLAEGMCVLHRCDNPACVNLDHLFVGTHAENMADKKAKGRCRSGRRNVLSVGQEQEIAAVYTGAYGQRTKLAAQYGVHVDTITNIARRADETRKIV